MKEKCTICIVGCGRVAEHYLQFFDLEILNSYQIVGVCDQHDEKVKNYAKKLGCPAYIDLKIMLEELRPNLVLILTPSGLHYQHAKLALEMGANVLCEKPITLIPEQAYELISYSEAHGLFYGVVFQNRLNKAVQFLKKAIDKNRFGTIISVSVRLRWCRYQEYYEDGWHGTWAMDGGVINQQAIHHIDALIYLLGPLNKVAAITANRVNKLEAEDTLVAAFSLDKGGVGTIEATTALRPSDQEASLTIVGENGIATVGGVALNKIEVWKFQEKMTEDDYISEHSQDVPNGYGISHGPFLQQVIDGLLFNKQKMVTARDGVRVVELVHAIYKSDELDLFQYLEEKPVSNRLGKRGING